MFRLPIPKMLDVLNDYTVLLYSDNEIQTALCAAEKLLVFGDRTVTMPEA